MRNLQFCLLDQEKMAAERHIIMDIQRCMAHRAKIAPTVTRVSPKVAKRAVRPRLGAMVEQRIEF